MPVYWERAGGARLVKVKEIKPAQAAHPEARALKRVRKRIPEHARPQRMRKRIPEHERSSECGSAGAGAGALLSACGEESREQRAESTLYMQPDP